MLHETMITLRCKIAVVKFSRQWRSSARIKPLPVQRRRPRLRFRHRRLDQQIARNMRNCDMQ